MQVLVSVGCVELLSNSTSGVAAAVTAATAGHALAPLATHLVSILGADAVAPDAQLVPINGNVVALTAKINIHS
jgi:hypothetical protein